MLVALSRFRSSIYEFGYVSCVKTKLLDVAAHGLSLTNWIMLSTTIRSGGVPVHDDRTSSNFYRWEGAQARIELVHSSAKRKPIERHLGSSDPEKVARYGKRNWHPCSNNPGIIRNKKKLSPLSTMLSVFRNSSTVGSF